MKSLLRLVGLVCTDQLAREMIERADHRHFFGLSRRRHAQIGAALGPRPRPDRYVGLTLVAIKQDDVAGLGLGLAQLKAQAHARDLAGDLATFQVCRGRRQRVFLVASKIPRRLSKASTVSDPLAILRVSGPLQFYSSM